jgi:hypothetical protein
VALAILVPFAIGLASIEAAAASKPFDGDWSIFIYGTPGKCRFGYRLPLTISDGNVLYKGRQVHPTVITVSSRGAVQIHLSDGRNIVTGTGALGTRRGSGKWTAPRFHCTGYWHARKR